VIGAISTDDAYLCPAVADEERRHAA